jgi:hypothetical protein
MHIEIETDDYFVKIYNKDIDKAKVFLKGQQTPLPINDKRRESTILMLNLVGWENLEPKMK